MARVELKNAGKTYGAIQVIPGLNLEIPDGAFTVFVGPSGCGKSTLLRMIAGLEEVTKGDLLIGGRVVNRETPTQRGVAMVFQNYALYPHMTVEQNIGFGLKMGGVSRAEIARKTQAAAKSLKIEALMKRKPAELSGGQRQRVAIGRAIVREPEVFLFDEPLSNLDAELRVSMRMEIARLHRELGATMIYVTHDQVEAMTLADQIVVLSKGHIEQVGTPQVLYERPDNLFVAGFIGSPRMNFVPAELAPEEVRLADGTRVPLRARRHPGVQGGVTFGVRPEHVRVVDGSGTTALLVDAVVYLGGTRFVYGRLSDGSDLTVEHREGAAPRPGEQMPLDLGGSLFHIFGADGRRLEPVPVA